MAWKVITAHGEDITIEAVPAVDLSGGVLTGLYTCTARAILASYVRRDSTVEIVLVSAKDEIRALEKVERAIRAGTMMRRKPGEA